MNQKTKFLILILMTFTFIKVYGEEKKSLTVDECVNIGLKNSKTLMISQSKIDFAKEKSSEVDAAMLPSLKFAGGYTRLSPVVPFTINFAGKDMTISPSILDNYAMKLSLQQPVFTGMRLLNNSNMMEQQAKASGEDYNKDKSQLIFDIKNAYWSLFKIMELKKIIDENISQTKAHIADVESFYKNGTATLNDVLKIKVQLSNIELLKIDAENNLQISSISLNSLIGLPLFTEVEVKSKPEDKKLSYNEVKTILDKALKERSEIKAMELRVKAGEYGVKLAEASWYPQINFMANYYYNRPNQRIFPSQDKFMGTWDIGLMLSMDIWNWMTTSHQTSQASANLDQTKYGLSQLKDAIILDVSTSYLSASKAKEKIDASRDAVAQAEENYRVTNEKFKSGMAINSDLLDAEVALLQAKSNYITAIVDFEIALAKLDKAIGK